ncbi:18562_t:CDS:2, partial [Racocetra persica]
ISKPSSRVYFRALFSPKWTSRGDESHIELTANVSYFALYKIILYIYTGIIDLRDVDMGTILEILTEVVTASMLAVVTAGMLVVITADMLAVITAGMLAVVADGVLAVFAAVVLIVVAAVVLVVVA